MDFVAQSLQTSAISHLTSMPTPSLPPLACHPPGLSLSLSQHRGVPGLPGLLTDSNQKSRVVSQRAQSRWAQPHKATLLTRDPRSMP